jgi:hypothetical protein
MHNHNGKNGKSMMWMMIPCLLLIAFALLGGGNLASSKYLWLIIVGVCVIPHIWMMFKGHGGHGDDSVEDKTNDASEKQLEAKEKYNKSGHGGSCCH